MIKQEKTIEHCLIPEPAIGLCGIDLMPIAKLMAHGIAIVSRR